MSFFGWLTKGGCEISGLDRLAGVVEISFCFVVFLLVYALLFNGGGRR
jgi:hypothetical protein